jgi:hypothetical protein
MIAHSTGAQTQSRKTKADEKGVPGVGSLEVPPSLSLTLTPATPLLQGAAIGEYGTNKHTILRLPCRLLILVVRWRRVGITRRRRSRILGDGMMMMERSLTYLRWILGREEVTEAGKERTGLKNWERNHTTRLRRRP